MGWKQCKKSSVDSNNSLLCYDWSNDYVRNRLFITTMGVRELRVYLRKDENGKEQEMILFKDILKWAEKLNKSLDNVKKK